MRTFDTPSRWLDGMLISRVGITTHAATTTALTWAAPESFARMLVVEAGTVGVVAAAIFSLAFVISLCDLVVNDLMPERVQLRQARRYRWLSIAALGVIYIMLGMAGAIYVRPPGAWALFVSYVTTGAGCLWWSAAAVTRRYRSAVGWQEERRGADELA